MHKASAYYALTRELERWRAMPSATLVSSIAQHASVRRANIDGEEFQIEVTVCWHDISRTAVRLIAVANGPSHWRLERLEESTIVPVPPGST